MRTFLTVYLHGAAVYTLRAPSTSSAVPVVVPPSQVEVAVMKPSRGVSPILTDRETSPHHPRRAEPPAAPPPAKRILLVDDSRVTRELMKVYLIARDVELLEAADGFEAVDVIRSRRPDLVLADLRMPRLDGFGLCAAIQADPDLARIPIVILSSYANAEGELRLRAAGAREVLRKPIQPQPLLEVVRRHLVPGIGAPRPREAPGAAALEVP
jgi:CheY-like chemotaxis protein